LSSKVIKHYKYVGDESEQMVQHLSVMKSGDFNPPEYEQFDPELARLQKKNAAAKTVEPVGARATVADKQSPTLNNRLAGKPSSAFVAETAADYQRIAVVDDQSREAELKAALEKQAADARKQGYDSGFQEGKNSALADARALQSQALGIITSIKSELNKQRDKYFEEIAKVAMDMSLHLAKKIIGDAASMMPDIIKLNVDKCVELLAGSGTVQIKINPADYDTLKSYLPQLEQKQEGKFTFVLEPENQIERGGCLIAFEGSTIDGRIETQIEKLKQQMEMLT
jgi:flagellar biosynthesis/type III secretory pathway protein FliH